MCLGRMPAKVTEDLEIAKSTGVSDMNKMNGIAIRTMESTNITHNKVDLSVYIGSLTAPVSSSTMTERPSGQNLSIEY